MAARAAVVRLTRGGPSLWWVLAALAALLLDAGGRVAAELVQVPRDMEQRGAEPRLFEQAGGEQAGAGVRAGVSLRDAPARLALGAAAAAADERRVYVVTGATGRTGQIAWKLLHASKGLAARALVRNATKARQLLQCGACGPDEGVFVGDVTQPRSLGAAFEGAFGLVICTGALPIKGADGKWSYPPGGFPVDVDWQGVVNQVMVAKNKGVKHVILVSSMGTSKPYSHLDRLGDGFSLFYKLNAEAFLMQSRLPYTIVKPCGLTDKTADLGTQVGSCDSFPHLQPVPIIARVRVAGILVAAASAWPDSSWTRFDVCADPLRPLAKEDYPAIFRAAADELVRCQRTPLDAPSP
jgi:hypothetical protein